MNASEFRDIRNHGFFRVAAVSPVVHRANPLKNAEEHCSWVERAHGVGAQLIVFPELGMNGGYTIQDLHHQELIHRQTDKAIEWFLKETEDYHAVIVFGASVVVGDLLFNGAYVTLHGVVLGIIMKTSPPNYDEFTELRWFHGANELPVKEIVKFGQTIPVGNDLIFCSTDSQVTISGDICEDRWLPIPPSTLNALAGARILFNVSASNYQVEKAEWHRHLGRRSGDDLTAYVYATAGYGESTTGLVFDGHNVIADRGVILAEGEHFSANGSMIVQDCDLAALQADRMRIKTWGENARRFRDLFPVRRINFTCELGVKGESSVYEHFERTFDSNPFVPKSDKEMELMHMARVTGLRTRMEYLPPSMRKIVIGLSGGKDSASILMQAVRLVDLFGDELGMTRQDITCITMPGYGTSDATYDYATDLAEALGVSFQSVPIKEIVATILAAIGYPYSILVADIEETQDQKRKSQLKLLFENVQVWARKYIELTTSAVDGAIDLGSTSGSEALIGWFTLFGDGSSHYASNVGMGKSVVPMELEWLADTVYSEQKRLGELLRGIARSASSPELLPLSSTGTVLQKSEEENGPDKVRDFFAYWMLRFRKRPLTLYRLALEVYGKDFTPQQLYLWLHRFITRMFTHRYKINMQSIDTVKVGSVAPGAHDFTKIPSDISPRLWLDELETLPEEFRL
jgi:NAD+ synthase (glutamine-hydrolysing)